MTEIPEIIKIENKSHIAILDTSSISFMQILYAKGYRKIYKYINIEEIIWKRKF